MLLVWSSRDTRKRRGLLWKTSVWIHTKMADACQTHSPFSLSVTQINVLKMGVCCFLTGTARSVETNTCSTVGRIKGIWFGIFWKEIAATHAVFGQSAELKRPPLWQTKWPVVKKKTAKNKQTKPRCCHSEARSAYPWCRWDKDSRLSKSFQ